MSFIEPYKQAATKTEEDIRTQEKFVDDLTQYLTKTDGYSWKVMIETGEDLHGNRAFRVRIDDGEAVHKASLIINLEFSDEGSQTTIKIIPHRPDTTKEQSLYFVDVKHIMSKAAAETGVTCTDKQRGVFTLNANSRFENVHRKFAEFMNMVGHDILYREHSSERLLSSAVQPRLPLHRDFGFN